MVSDPISGRLRNHSSCLDGFWSVSSFLFALVFFKGKRNGIWGCEIRSDSSSVSRVVFGVCGNSSCVLDWSWDLAYASILWKKEPEGPYSVRSVSRFRELSCLLFSRYSFVV